MKEVEDFSWLSERKCLFKTFKNMRVDGYWLVVDVLFCFVCVLFLSFKNGVNCIIIKSVNLQPPSLPLSFSV